MIKLQNVPRSFFQFFSGNIYIYAYQTYSEGESLRKKYLKRNLSPEKIFQKMFRQTLLSKDSSKEALKRHSLQKIEEKPLSQSLSRDISSAKKIRKYI